CSKTRIEIRSPAESMGLRAAGNSTARSVVTVAVEGVCTVGPGPLNCAKQAEHVASTSMAMKETNRRCELRRSGLDGRVVILHLRCAGLTSRFRATPT